MELQIAIGLAIAITLLLTLVAMLVEQAVRRPIERLKHAIGEVAKGNFAVRVEAEGRDEIAAMCSAFSSLRRISTRRSARPTRCSRQSRAATSASAWWPSCRAIWRSSRKRRERHAAACTTMDALNAVMPWPPVTRRACTGMWKANRATRWTPR